MIEHEDIYKGFNLKVVATDMGHRCGYIRIPIDHPLHIVDYDEEAVNTLNVHGGITYAQFEDDEEWWIGFDCAHIGDAKDHALMNDEWKKFYEDYPWHYSGTVRTKEFVLAELHKLIDQIT